MFAIFLTATIVPWYTLILFQEDPFPSVGTSIHFFYTTKWIYCNDCDSSFEFESIPFDGEDVWSRSIFAISFIFSSISTLVAVIAILLPLRGIPFIISAINSALGMLSLIFLPFALTKDGCETPGSGPCNSFLGLEEGLRSHYFWGPSFGWYLSAIAIVLSLLFFVISFFCLSKKKKHEDIVPNGTYINYEIYNNGNENTSLYDQQDPNGKFYGAATTGNKPIYSYA